MTSTRLRAAVPAMALLVIASGSRAQTGGSDVYWHIDPSVKTCSMVIDPSLTQAQWHTFTEQVGAIMFFKGLAPAPALGKGRIYIGIDGAYTPVDQHDPAWINTFTHPDASCPLGDAISYPALRARVGLSRSVDVAGYWTTAPDANYGAVGGAVKYAFLQESPKRPAAAASASVTMLTGVPDFNLSMYSLELLASKKIAVLTPYLGVRQGLVVGTEMTSKVALETERVAVTQGYVGVAYSIWMLNLAAEYDIASVNTFAIAIAFQR